MNLDILELLPVYFLPQRFQAICSLEVGPSNSFTEVERDSLEYKQWERVWTLIASMQGLRHIRVWLTGHQFDEVVLTPAAERLLLEPLLVVQGVPDFQVDLVSEASGAEMFQDTPFQVNRFLPDSEDRVSLKEWVSGDQRSPEE
ncbi:hypothetical protein N7474_005917 [Penicillium riverlandense]|uniref:uncharacterized protein n=1 Tax=Penicillium riverlandense TaxID=1903569 RepID=UPI0025489D00|nr:uncharacterized protein N7474_005917 [Penicillium riverlandense]KAJ5820326.1 hypothetical protein N7474_005917 [Penicillium riverlandense]